MSCIAPFTNLLPSSCKEVLTQPSVSSFCPPIPFQLHLCHPAAPSGWTLWSPWSDCPVSCGGGHQVRTRTCMVSVPQRSEPPCLGSDTETQYCGQQPCLPLLDVCSWGPWGPCSHTCGPGLTSRSGSCSCLLAKADSMCNGTVTHLETQACYPGPCLGKPAWEAKSPPLLPYIGPQINVCPRLLLSLTLCFVPLLLSPLSFRGLTFLLGQGCLPNTAFLNPRFPFSFLLCKVLARAGMRGEGAGQRLGGS